LILRKNAADSKATRKIRSSIQNTNKNKKENESLKVDEKDIKIISSLLSGYDNQQISLEFRIPLSTIQRRSRIILKSGLLKHYFRPDYRRLGLKKE
jgi:DNA-binding NarL/FixJ family response regulator